MSIDWEEQWRSFAPSFYQGVAHIDLSAYAPNISSELLLKPGGGFGDLSHPTTRLCLRLMAHRVAGTTLVDIGCGSGILTLAALLMGARAGIGIDIEDDALQHAQENACLNQLDKKVVFAKQVERVTQPLFIAMNMIFSEQMIAWTSQQVVHGAAATIATSGILTEQRDSYLAWTDQLGWRCLREESEEGWSGFLFSKPSQK